MCIYMQVHIHIQTVNWRKVEDINWKKKLEGYIGGFIGRKGKGEKRIISKNKRNIHVFIYIYMCI